MGRHFHPDISFFGLFCAHRRRNGASSSRPSLPPPSSKRGTWSAARYNFIYFSIGAICRFAAIPQGRSGRAGNIPDMRQMRSVYLKSASLLAAISLPVAHTFFQVTLLLLIVSVGRLLSAENCRLICYSKTFSRRLI